MIPVALLGPSIVVLLGLTLSRSGLGEETDLDAKTQQLEQLKVRIEQLQSQLKAVENERQQHSTALGENEKRIGLIARRIRVASQALERQGRRLAALEQARADSRLKLDRHQQLMEQQVRAAYVTGRQEKLKILLNQQDPAVVSRMLVYYDYLNKARFQQIALLQGQLDRLARIEHEIVTEEQRLQQLQTKQAAEQQRLELVQSERERIIDALNLTLKSKEQELAGLQSNAQQLATLLTELQDALADIPMDPAAQNPFASRKGSLPWPTQGQLAASFGSTREIGSLRWDGVLIEAPEGLEVRSVHHGRVAFADWLRGFGLLLIIDHGEGYMSLYGHNQSLFKETGEWVEAGEVIAQVGSSGGRSTPGIYFGIRHNGEPKDPKHWCKRLTRSDKRTL
jgi:septal ring factor EnvC (AmiA/AmiB activator)